MLLSISSTRNGVIVVFVCSDREKGILQPSTTTTLRSAVLLLWKEAAEVAALAAGRLKRSSSIPAPLDFFSHLRNERRHNKAVTGALRGDECVQGSAAGTMRLVCAICGGKTQIATWVCCD